MQIELAKLHPELSMGSYPFNQNGDLGTNVVIRGTDAENVRTVAARLAEIAQDLS